MAKKLLIKGIKSLKQVLCDVRGIALTETLVAMGIIAVVAVAYLMGMSATSKAILISEERVTAENLAKSQMEYIRSQPYDDVNNPPLYSPEMMSVDDIQNGYDVDIQTERVNPLEGGTGTDVGLQKLTVLIYHSGTEVFKLEGYRVSEAAP
jgi:type II secretory pathway pseudopilin PulG